MEDDINQKGQKFRILVLRWFAI